MAIRTQGRLCGCGCREASGNCDHKQSAINADKALSVGCGRDRSESGGDRGHPGEDKAPGEGEGQACINCDPCSGGGTSKQWAHGAAFQSLADGSPVTVQMGQAVED